MYTLIISLCLFAKGNLDIHRYYIVIPLYLSMNENRVEKIKKKT